MSRKTKDRRSVVLSSPEHMELQEVAIKDRRAERPPVPFKGRDGQWHCGRESCKIESAQLFDLGDGLYICGHCYCEFNL